MHFGYLEITPELAKQILEKSEIRNRNVSHVTVDRYAEDMKRGKWDTENSSTLAFDKKGNLIDGQHRLHALIKAGVTLTFACFRECSDEAFKTIDIGKSRSLQDFLFIDKIIDGRSGRVGTILSRLYMVHFYNTITMYESAGRIVKSTATSYERLRRFITPLSSTEIDDVIKKCSSLRQKSQSFLNETPCAVIILAYMRQYAITKNNICLIYINQFESFLESICSTSNLQVGSQELAYKNTILRIRAKTKEIRIRSAFQYTALVNAWNNHIRNKCSKNLSYTTEKYLPRIYGYEYDYVEE